MKPLKSAQNQELQSGQRVLSFDSLSQGKVVFTEIVAVAASAEFPDEPVAVCADGAVRQGHNLFADDREGRKNALYYLQELNLALMKKQAALYEAMLEIETRPEDAR